MRAAILALFLVGRVLTATAAVQESRGPARGLDTARIETLTGAKGALDEKEGVFKVSVPRTDLTVTAAGVRITPPMGLTSWAAFKRAGDHTVVMGDLVLLEDQVNPVMTVALDQGLEVTALHNHFFWDTPKVMFMHIGGMGDEAALASAVGRVLAKIAATAGGKGDAPRAEIDPARTTLDPRRIEAILGRKGTLSAGVYKVVVGRAARMHGGEMAAAMGVNTWAAFAGSDEQAVVDGDFAMIEPELQGVLKALRGAGIQVVAIHHHMTGEEPRILFLHYWGVGRTEDLAKGLRAALDQTRHEPAAAGALGTAQEGKKVVSVKAAKAPSVDGKGDDEAWKAAPATEVVARRVVPPLPGASTPVKIQSVHTDTHVYVLVRWKDETRDDVAHKPWVWDASKNAYAEGPEREDMFALALEHTGAFDADMLSGAEAVWDVWHWKATRTNPQGYAMDRTHRYTREQWRGQGKSHQARNGQTIWIARPEDAGETVEKKQPAPASKQAERVPLYLPGTPTGSAADVKAKGAWSDGWWTLEFERRLTTGHEDDTRLDLGRSYKFAVAVHDRTGDMDKASGVITLVLGEN